MFNMNLEQIVLLAPVLLISLSVHEFAHGYSAYLLGDMIAKNDGRLTLNPLKHVDPIGALMFVLVGFGWAKPVRFNPMSFKSRIRDSIITALAGPISNFIIAFLAMLILGFMDYFNYEVTKSSISVYFIVFLNLSAIVNIALGVFNLLPIPPLDGSHLYMAYLAEKSPRMHAKIAANGFGILIAIIIVENYFNIDILPLGYIINSVEKFLNELVNRVIFIL